eukprot:TRINITY_DN29969_c0_g1_i1.p1 TRINITY_DN29969_c0_g1~~TRINITY_DN29969_c0_g1_i1.p1  ORF type:complete len:244 (-),score=69.02 TRINITY_DN29969_c0_g1_i1:199-930(-)
MQSMDADHGGAFQTSIKHATVEVRKGFVKKVYGILAAQLLLTIIIATPIAMQPKSWAMSNQWLLSVSAAMTMATMCAMACCRDVARKYPTNYVFLFTFTVFESVVVGFISAQYEPQSVLLCAVATMLIFLSLSAYAWKSQHDFTGMGPYLFGAMMSLMAMSFIIMIMGMCGVNVQWGLMFYDLCGVALFSMYIVYDTQLILGEFHGHKQQFDIDDYVFAALNLYLDIIDLFIFLLRLFGDRRE